MDRNQPSGATLEMETRENNPWDILGSVLEQLRTRERYTSVGRGFLLFDVN